MDNQHTFGKTQAAITLQKILSFLNDSKITKKVSCKIGQQGEILNKLRSIPDISIRRKLIEMMIRDSNLEMELPIHVKSFLKNVLKTRLRQELELCGKHK